MAFLYKTYICHSHIHSFKIKTIFFVKNITRFSKIFFSNTFYVQKKLFHNEVAINFKKGFAHSAKTKVSVMSACFPTCLNNTLVSILIL